MDGRGGRQLSRWLASSSAAALLIGASVPTAVAACAINDVGISTGPVSNAASIGCINIQNSTVSGSVTNAAGGTISASGTTAPAATGITINNSTITGTVNNAGVIRAATNTGILVTNSATVSGGITNTGTISAGQAGINVASDSASFSGGILNSGTISGSIQVGISTFTGGLTNSGTILSASTGISIGGGLVTSFSGGITNSGTISAGGANGIFLVNISTFSGGVLNSGTISATHTAIDITGGETFAGGVRNTGTLTAGGFSGIFVSGTTTFLGGITNSGTISGGNNGIDVESVSVFTGGITNSGTISASGRGIAVTAISTFTGGISNSGTIVAKTGIFISSSVGSFAGGITNTGNITGTGGTAIDASAASVAVSIGQAGGTVAGAIKLSANGDTLTQTGGSIAGSIIGQGNGQVVFNLGALSQTFGPSANITNVGVISVNSGTLTLDGPNNSATTVSLVGGTLAGTGTVAAAVTNSGGILAPGDTIGTFSITGNYVQGSAGTLKIAVSPQAASKLAVSGTASLGGTLKLVYAPGVYNQKTYDILHAGTVSGTFAAMSSNAGSLLSQSLFFTSSSGAITVTPNASTTDVDISTSEGTFEIDPGTDTALPALRNAALAGAQDANAGVLDYLARGQGGAFPQTARGDSGAQVAFAGNAQSLGAAVADLPARMSELGGWFRGQGTFATLSGGAPTVTSQTGGFLAGLDRPVATDLSAGIAFGYSHTSLAVHDGENGTIDTPRLMLYGRYDLGTWTLGATAGYGYDRFHTTRSVDSLAETASSSHDGHEATAALQASTRLAFGAVDIVPAVGFNYVHLYETGFTETGAALDDLRVAHQNSDSLRPFVGAQASEMFVTSGGTRIVPAASLTYSREFMNAPPSSVQIGGGTFAVDGLTPSRDAVTLGAGVAATLNNSLALFADYRATLPTGNLLAQSVSAGVTIRF